MPITHKRWFLAAIMLTVLAWPPAPSPAAGDVPTSAGRDRQLLQVGPGRRLQRPSQAARLATNGAVVEIDAGDYYGDVAVWRQHGLTLRGVGGRARLHADGRHVQGKGIWVITGDRVTVENIEFSGARVKSRNGAGIRAQGEGLTLRNCRFHHNEMGLLTNKSPRGVVVIEDSEFDHNSTDTERHGKLGHNIYIQRVARFELRRSHIHSARRGHQVKSRARVNLIEDNVIEDPDSVDGGASSYLIDIAEGGRAEVLRNRLVQGARSENRNAIAFGAEGRRRGGKHSLRVIGNRFRSDGRSGTFVRNFTDVPALLKGNVIEGQRVTALRGSGTVE